VLRFGEFYQKIVRRGPHQVNAEKTRPSITFDTPRMVIPSDSDAENSAKGLKEKHRASVCQR